MEDIYSRICCNLDLVRKRIERSAERSGRNPEDIMLVAVSKGQPLDVIRAAIKAGITIFGENYPEEGREKILNSGQMVQWHMIGHLQSRKIPIVIEHFHYIQSIDSLPLAEKLSRQLMMRGKKLPVLLEVNIGGEASKIGWAASSEALWENILLDFERIVALEGLEIKGLMTMPPFSVDPQESRSWFRNMVRLQSFLRGNSSIKTCKTWGVLSMGTSHDFENAIEEGATCVRIGEAILGAREP